MSAFKAVILSAIISSIAVSPALSIGLCKGGNRAARKLTCVVDGDTIWFEGRKMRLLAIDAPEIEHAQCPAERQVGHKATARLIELMNGGYSIDDSHRTGFYKRELVNVILSDGRDAGNVLLNEGLAQPWPNRGNIWCGRN